MTSKMRMGADGSARLGRTMMDILLRQSTFQDSTYPCNSVHRQATAGSAAWGGSGGLTGISDSRGKSSLARSTRQ